MPEVGIIKENKKTREQERKQELDKESDQEKKKKNFSFFLSACFFVFLLSVILIEMPRPAQDEPNKEGSVRM